METDTNTGNKISKRRQPGWKGTHARSRTHSKRRRAGMKGGNGGHSTFLDRYASYCAFAGNEAGYRSKPNHAARAVDVNLYFATVGMVKF